MRLRSWLMLFLFQLLALMPCAAYADAFLDQAFLWSVGERPELIISKGVVIAWIEDPSNHLPTDPDAYYWHDAERLIIVAPGTPMLIFPPRDNQISLPAQNIFSGRFIRPAQIQSRLQSPDYWLCVTQDGFWGVFNKSQTKLYIDESDLTKMAREEESSDSGTPLFGMALTTATNLQESDSSSNIAVGLTRGEMFRIEEDDGSTSKIDFGGDIPSITSKQADLAQKRGTQSVGTISFSLSDDLYKQIQVSGALVPEADLSSWLNGVGNYRDIFNSAFSDIRIPQEEFVDVTCGQTISVSSEEASNASIAASAQIGATTNFWRILTATLSINGAAGASFTQTIQKTLQKTTLIGEHLFPVTENGPNGTSEFWAGTASTCNDSPNVKTLVVVDADQTVYLHKEFYEVDQKGVFLNHLIDPTEPKLEGLTGGSPFDQITGALNPVCFKQELGFLGIAEHTMYPLTSQVEAALNLDVGRQAENTNLVHFYSDNGCRAQ